MSGMATAPILCDRPGVKTQRGSTIPCEAHAVGRCKKHGNACRLHSDYRIVGPRQCEECHTPLTAPKEKRKKIAPADKEAKERGA